MNNIDDKVNSHRNAVGLARLCAARTNYMALGRALAKVHIKNRRASRQIFDGLATFYDPLLLPPDEALSSILSFCDGFALSALERTYRCLHGLRMPA